MPVPEREPTVATGRTTPGVPVPDALDAAATLPYDTEPGPGRDGGGRDREGRGRMAGARSKTRIGEANVERILDAALSIFSRYGLRGARTDQIAEAAGMSKPNLLYYFRSKELLYTAVLERTLAMWLDPLARIDPDADPKVALADYIGRKLASARSNPDESRLFATEIVQGAPRLKAALRRDLAPLVDAKVATLRRWIDQGKLAPIDPITLIFMIWATTQHYADFAAQVEVLTGRDLTDPAFYERTRETIVSVILAGVLPRET